jgi:hypothetical protein
VSLRVALGTELKIRHPRGSPLLILERTKEWKLFSPSSTAKKTKFQGKVAAATTSISSGFWCIMSLFLVVFCCVSVTRAILRFDSQFGIFISRLGAKKFPFGCQREFVSNGLIWLTVSSAKTAFFGHNRKITGSTGIAANLAAR